MDERKKRVIENLKNNTFCKIGVSKVHGVGVIAVRDIALGTSIFTVSNRKISNGDEIIDLSEDDLEGADERVLVYMKSHFPMSHIGTYPAPEGGLNSMTLAFYLNHSGNPNVLPQQDEGDPNGYCKFVTCEDVMEGEELLQDYNILSQTPLHDQYPFLMNQSQ